MVSLKKTTNDKQNVKRQRSFLKPLFRSALTSLALSGASLGTPKEAEAIPDPPLIKQSVSIPESSETLTPATLTLLNENFWEDATEEEILDLISMGADVNAQDENGLTPIHFAILHGDIPLLKVLIENGAKLDIPDKNGFVPAQIMAAHGIPISEVLPENGDFQGTTPNTSYQQKNNLGKTTNAKSKRATKHGNSLLNEEQQENNTSNNQSFIISNEDIAIALNPKSNTVSIDENGNFVDESSGIIYTRDLDNPNVLHGYDPNNEGKEQTVTLGVTPEGGVSLNSSFDADPQKITMSRTINPDGSYQELSPFSKNGLKTKTVEADGTEKTDFLDDNGIPYKSELINPDGTKAVVETDRFLQKKPDGSAMFEQINPDKTSIEVEKDGKGLTRRTHLDENKNPVLMEEEKNGTTKYFKQGTDGQWHEMPSPEKEDENGFIVDASATTAEIEKLKKMSPEEVDKFLAQQAKESEQPQVQQELEQPEIPPLTPPKPETLFSQNPTPVFPKPHIPQFYTPGENLSITNNVEKTETVLNKTLSEGVKEGADDFRNETRVEENKPSKIPLIPAKHSETTR